eukprot:CAMPEP_0206028818 /NCGR_PEP_ID=MMETSP1464-20131121/45632_1 /ASSEMBLY_ACC=CAM_ASM_001124 /TAXON_ID=119497 /ORGANISM="Exanthemachrysis gayraliae, Strain RCC1523" /LENGTH=310 /DNA_ID=CAMNT_0053402891 /DNA_START=23 /DNA_END=955 /DNA_ORIENTATION=-
MIREWHGIDHHRLDKFLVLMRMMWRATCDMLAAEAWPALTLERVATIMAEYPLNPRIDASHVSIRTHVCDVFLDELKTLEGATEDVTNALLGPFYALLRQSKQRAVVGRVADAVFGAVAESMSLPADEQQRIRPRFSASAIVDELTSIANDVGCVDANRGVVYGLRDRFEGIGGGQAAKAARTGPNSTTARALLKSTFEELSQPAGKKKRPKEPLMRAALAAQPPSDGTNGTTHQKRPAHDPDLRPQGSLKQVRRMGATNGKRRRSEGDARTAARPSAGLEKANIPDPPPERKRRVTFSPTKVVRKYVKS